MGNLAKWIEQNTCGMGSVCELGAGKFDNMQYCNTPIKIGIELIKEYYENRVCGEEVLAIHGDALEFNKFLNGFNPEVFLLIDFIEHLDKNVAVELIKEIQKITKRILIFTPHGTHNQTGEESFDFGDVELRKKIEAAGSVKDAVEAQRHKSKWYAQDLSDLGFSVNVDSGHHPRNIWSMKDLIGEDGGAVIWAVWNK